MKNIINKTVLLLLILSLSSCGVFNKVFKTSSKFKEKTSVELNKDIETNIKDKSITIVEENVDTIIRTKGRTDKSYVSIRSIKDISNLTILNNDLFYISQTFDSVGNTLNTTVTSKPQDINININKKTTTTNDINTNTITKIDSVATKDIKFKNTVKEKEPINMFWLAVLGISVLTTMYFISRVFKK